MSSSPANVTGADWDTSPADARATISHWDANPQLVRKHYPLGGNGKERAEPLSPAGTESR